MICLFCIFSFLIMVNWITVRNLEKKKKKSALNFSILAK